MRIIHIEVGGSYGGSLRALENYLSFSDKSRFEHDLMLYYPTPGAERLRPLVKNFFVRFPAVPQSALSGAGAKSFPSWRKWLKGSRTRAHFGQARDWLRTAKLYPRACRLAGELRAGKYDLVHVNNTLTFNLEALIAAKKARLRAVGHGRNPIESNAFSRWAVRMTSGVATVNQRLSRQLSPWAPTLPILTCYDGIALASVHPEIVCDLRSRLAPPSKYRMLIGSAGRLDQQKGYVDFITAARKVLDVHQDVSFVVAGDGPFREELQRLINEFGIAENFHLLGFRADIQNVISALDLFVSSSLWEGLPIVAVESIMLGKPLVVTDVGGSAEVVKQGKTGYVVPSGNSTVLAQGILDAIENLPLLANGVQEWRDRLIGPMEVKASARVLDDFFERVAERKA